MTTISSDAHALLTSGALAHLATIDPAGLDAFKAANEVLKEMGAFERKK